MNKTKYCYICIIVVMFFLSSCQQDIQAFSFENYPNGTPVILDNMGYSGEPFHPIQGDMYVDWGFYLHSTPVDDCLAINTSDNESADLFLGLNTQSECGDAIRLEIEFIEPVKSIDVAFVGGKLIYSMDIIDSGGEVFDSSSIICDGKFDGTLTHLTYTSSTANIKKISLGSKTGMALSGINIKELNFGR